MPNPTLSLEKLENTNPVVSNNDVFFAMSHGVHRGILKKGKYDESLNYTSDKLDKTLNAGLRR